MDKCTKKAFDKFHGSNEYKDKPYMNNLIKDIINEVGPQNLIQIRLAHGLIFLKKYIF